MISADFIFSFVLAFGLCAVLFVVTFTFAVTEVAQYVVFSASRAHAAAHVDAQTQAKMAQDKFDELLGNQVLAPMFKADGWFVLNNLDVRSGGYNGKTFDNEYAGYKKRVPFIGVRADFEPRILSIRVPFLGTTNNPSGDGYKAKLTAFLIREPSQKECWDQQIKVRYRAVLELDQRYKGSGTVNALSGVEKYFPMEDNGC